MYLYFFDTWTQEKKYELLLGKIQSRLAVLGLTGKQERRSIFVDVKRSFREAVERGVHTIIAVGDDHTLMTTLNVAIPLNVTVGFIPLVPQSQFARLLDLPVGPDACDVIAKRLCESIDAVRFGDVYCIGSAQTQTPVKVEASTAEHCSFHAKEPMRLQIDVLGDLISSSDHHTVCPSGKMKVSLEAPARKKSFFSFRAETTPPKQTQLFTSELQLRTADGSSATLVVDHQWNVPLPCTAVAVPNAIKLIVGRNRKIHSSESSYKKSAAA